MMIYYRRIIIEEQWKKTVKHSLDILWKPEVFTSEVREVQCVIDGNKIEKL